MRWSSSGVDEARMASTTSMLKPGFIFRFFGSSICQINTSTCNKIRHTGKTWPTLLARVLCVLHTWFDSSFNL